jgi:hypothetical protein
VSHWIVAYCRHPVYELSVVELAGALGHATYQVEEVPGDQPRRLRVRYRNDDASTGWFSLALYRKPEFVSSTVQSVLAGAPPRRARDMLREVVQTAAIELDRADLAGRGIHVALSLALWIADPARGDGMVESEGEWWDPKIAARIV